MEKIGVPVMQIIPTACYLDSISAAARDRLDGVDMLWIENVTWYVPA
jgi:hypothetical protein